ncbi:MAG: hypothetical protein JWO35_788 [Candidatus Saccharibacteria bacterium]|nr:hypothetical protein [Candidatus Saccharibacteria bacterium]
MEMMGESIMWRGAQDRELLLPVKEAFHQELLDQVKRPPGDDAVTSAFYERLSQEPEISPLSIAIEDMIDFRMKREDGTVSPSLLVNNVRASIFTFLTTSKQTNGDRNKFSFKGLDTPESWNKHFDLVNQALSSVYSPYKKDRSTDALSFNLQYRNAQTNIAERYGPLELIMQSLAERFPNGIDWLDVGSGIMEGAQQLTHKAVYPLGFKSVDRVGNNFKTKDEQLTHKANRLVRQTSLLNDIVCVDLNDVYHTINGRSGYDQGNLEWARGSLRPGEQSDPRFMMKFNGLVAEKSSNITFTRADLSDETGAAQFAEKHPGKTFDVISLMTMLHQMPDEKKHSITERAKRLLSPGGIIVIQDFAYLPPAKRPLPIESLKMYAHWHDRGRYRTFVYDSALEKRGLQEVFRFKGSRCEDLAIAGGRLLVNNETYPMGYIIKHA